MTDRRRFAAIATGVKILGWRSLLASWRTISAALGGGLAAPLAWGQPFGDSCLPGAYREEQSDRQF
jgi:hypothetical protein